MSNFYIDFSNPWLLLLLIPAVFFALFPYFRLSKKYRRTRNRVVSIVLHLCVMILCISLLAGISFRYEIPNTKNEVLLLVDSSFSSQEAQQKKDEFIRSAIDEKLDSVKMGIVTFGYNQIYAAELTYDADELFSQYLEAQQPDNSATDVASALEYASRLFSNPETAKIVLISDGAETDRKASTIIKSIAAEGIKVDTVLIPEEERGAETELIGVTYPEEKIIVNQKFSLGITVQSSFEGKAKIVLYDNDEKVGEIAQIDLVEGIQTIEFEHTFTSAGLHKISFSIESDEDTLAENNSFYSYVYLEVFDDILIIERNENESSQLKGILEQSYNVNVVNILEGDGVPETVDELREYDQVILVNIANADMPRGFDEILNSYVYEFGGGLFTVGGNKTDGATGETVANTYNRQDMENTLYQQMLPVQAIDYTPPVGVMIIIDRSGSMGSQVGNTGKTRLDLAKEGARACLDALTVRDYCGIMTLETTYSEEVEVTPLPEVSKIEAAISGITIGGGTNYEPAITRAGEALKAVNVDRRHIIIISDAEPNDRLYDNVVEQTGGFGGKIKHYYDTAGITCSIVSISSSSARDEDLRIAAEELGHGQYIKVTDLTTLPQKMAEDLTVPAIKEYNPEPFTPIIGEHTSVVNGISQSSMPQLGGYYGTKAKDGAEVPLKAEFVPIYAQWDYGKGTVGSFMCDLNGTWSAEFLGSDTGVRLIGNIVSELFPSENIHSQDISAKLEEENYSTQMSIFTSLQEGETIELTITGPAGADGKPTEQKIGPFASEEYSRISFAITQPGIHNILIEKKNINGEVISQYTTYKAFSYSAEYNMFIDEEACRLFLTELAEDGKGAAVSEAWEIFETFTNTLKKSFDPRYWFIAIALILFLLDIAVRKFKFKWPHEIIRDRKLKKLLSQDKQNVPKEKL